jgi:hypothetical protein
MDLDDATLEVDELIDRKFELTILSILLELDDDSVRFPDAQQGRQYADNSLIRTTLIVYVLFYACLRRPFIA